MKATTTVSAIAYFATSALGLSFMPVEEVGPSDPAKRPPVAEQQAAAITLIADSILSPELSVVAVVQSRKDTFLRIDALRMDHYGIEDFDKFLHISQVVRALNMTPLYRVETVYAPSSLPPILAVIEDKMYWPKIWLPHEKPMNFRPALFPYDNTVWLVLLKTDSIFKYSMKPFHVERTAREAIENVLTRQTEVAGLNQGLMLEGVLSETNQFSTVKPYANFPIKKPGLDLDPFIIEGELITSDKQTPNPIWPGRDLDLSKELVLPAEFLADLRHIIQFAADYEPDLALPATQTPLGGQVLNRVREKLDEGASKAHLRGDWLRPPEL